MKHYLATAGRHWLSRATVGASRVCVNDDRRFRRGTSCGPSGRRQRRGRLGVSPPLSRPADALVERRNAALSHRSDPPTLVCALMRDPMAIRTSAARQLGKRPLHAAPPGDRMRGGRGGPVARASPAGLPNVNYRLAPGGDRRGPRARPGDRVRPEEVFNTLSTNLGYKIT